MPAAPPPPRPRGRGGLKLACHQLPREVREDALRLYGALRHIDDLVDDEAPTAREAVEALEFWARSGVVHSAEAELLERLCTERGLPRGAVLEFCHGMGEDLDRRVIRTEADLDRYCHRVAGTVGLMMAAMLGMRAPGLAAAATLGTAMQRTNVLRDLDEDAARGRTYIAQETIARFGAPAPGRREGLVRDQIARADRLYDRGVAGIPALARGRWAIAAAAATYREILRQIERDGCGRQPGRAVVAPGRRVWVAVRLGATVARCPAPDACEPCSATPGGSLRLADRAPSGRTGLAASRRG